ncbi:heavy metal translocating P-type ATPase [Schauerella aestuarii]|uniref:heavy metal translocating P-type ATPase n=1 Tax=Schauerella aestuarii TaxID=2511204 RepID=UPI001368A279|nr:heavy metal translocating P-type ATPase [Achromobacter aestuarii]MYZ41523.1 heavy metal translocating P-type ATPase [Achromobacter aestuarii]
MPTATRPDPHDHDRPAPGADAPAHAEGHDHHAHDGDTCGHNHAAHAGHSHGHAESKADEHANGHAADACCGHDHAPATAAPVDATAAAAALAATAVGTVTVLRISGMDCPTEEGLIRKQLTGRSDVHAMDFNLVSRTLAVDHVTDALPAIQAALADIGLPGQIVGSEADPGDHAGHALPIWRLAVSGAAAIASETVYWATDGNSWMVMALAAIAILTCGLSTYKKGWIALRHFNLNINALMAIAVTGAVLIGHWPEAAMVMVLFTVAELIEAKSLDRARNAIRGLLALTPEVATVQDAQGAWTDVPSGEVAIGSLVRVKPGERIALDGEVVEGRSAVDQSPITGESLPVDKTVGDVVYGGTINASGALTFRVTAVARDSTLARIIHAVEAAQGSRAPTQRFVDQFSRIYTPAVFMVAIAVAAVPPLFMGADAFTWIYRALVLLVIACPCALVISTPVTIVSGLAAAARRGILIKGGVYLEMGHTLKVLALDKTGTITRGKPSRTDEVLWGDDPARAAQLAYSLSARSDHPVSKAIAQAAEASGSNALPVDDFEALLGVGVRGTIAGVTYTLGSRRLLSTAAVAAATTATATTTIGAVGISFAELEQQVDALESQGKTVVLLTQGSDVLALYAVADTIKEASREAIAELHRLGVKTVMLTGDNPHTARAIAREAGIDEAHGGQMPEDKLRYIESAVDAAGGRVGMVGDGINDAPALARADIGFAMGAAGTDAAIETADVAIMDDDLRKIARFMRMSRATANVLKQNIAFALVIKAVFVALTFSGQATMWMAVFADMGASLLVVFNGLRLLKTA